MSETNIGVSITADVADLQAKLALAQSEFRNSNKELKALADQMTAAGEAGQAELLPGLQAAASAAASAKAEVNALNAELRESTGAAHEASGAFIQIRESVEGLHASIRETTGLFTTLGELFLVGFGIERVSEFVLKSAELGEEMVRTSQKTGIAVESLSELKFAAETSGVSFDNLQTGLKKLAAAVQESLLTPTSKAAAAFEQLGISSVLAASPCIALRFCCMRASSSLAPSSARLRWRNPAHRPHWISTRRSGSPRNSRPSWPTARRRSPSFRKRSMPKTPPRSRSSTTTSGS